MDAPGSLTSRIDEIPLDTERGFEYSKGGFLVLWRLVYMRVRAQL